jgi:hypothetical protein
MNQPYYQSTLPSINPRVRGGQLTISAITFEKKYNSPSRVKKGKISLILIAGNYPESGQIAV